MSSNEPVWPSDLFSDLDRTGPMPLYYQVSSRLERAIRSGEIPAGARLENEIEIGHRLGLSRPTVRRAIQELVDKGLLVRRRGIGTQVVQGDIPRESGINSLYDDITKLGHIPSTRVLSLNLIEVSPEISSRLGISEGSEALHIRRLRLSDGEPVAILENWLPRDMAELSSRMLEQHSLYQLLQNVGVTVRVAKQRVSARLDRGDEAELLAVTPGSALISTQRDAFDTAGRAVFCGDHCYRPDKYQFEMTLVAK